MGALNIFVTHTIYCCIIKLDECINLTGSDAKIINNLENNIFSVGCWDRWPNRLPQDENQEFQ